METDGKIKDLLDPTSDVANIKLLLANTVYFKGDWKSKFHEVQTHERPFYVSHYKVVKTPFMFQRGKDTFSTSLNQPSHSTLFLRLSNALQLVS